MLKNKIGDLLNVKKGIIAHGCNCSGGFGSGVAGAIRQKWPQVFQQFRMDIPTARLGWCRFIQINEGLWVANMYTQQKYGPIGSGTYASLEAIERSLVAAAMFARNKNTSLAIPRIGCGLGGLKWGRTVEPVVQQVAMQFSDLNITVYSLGD